MISSGGSHQVYEQLCVKQGCSSVVVTARTTGQRPGGALGGKARYFLQLVPSVMFACCRHIQLSVPTIDLTMKGVKRTFRVKHWLKKSCVAW